MDSTLLNHITSAGLVVYGLQMVKSLPWYHRLTAALPWETAMVHRIVSAIAAFVTAIGIHVAVNGSSALGWQLGATIPPVAVLLHGCWDWANQFCLQQLAYDAVVQKAGAVVAPAPIQVPPASVTVLTPGHGPAGPIR